MSWPQARERAYTSGRPLTPVYVPLAAAVGLVLASDVVALTDLPAADTSAMDGWAVAGTGPWVVMGSSLAGRPYGAVLEAGQAAVLTTGAGVPEGATGIVRSERATADDGKVTLDDPGPVDLADLRRRGREASAGEVLVPAGGRVTPAVIGLAAAAGHDVLTVHPAPRVAVLVLGDELLDDGPPRAGRVRDALGVQLPAWITWLGGVTTDVTRVADDRTSTFGALAAAVARADVVVTSGGSASGAADHLRAAVAWNQGQVLVDTVDVRPGRPMLLARMPGGARVIGLPGNPLAALAGVLTLLAPLLARLRGAAPPGEEMLRVAVDVAAPGTGHALVPAVRDDDGRLVPTGHDTAAMLRGVAAADVVLVVPPPGVAAGAEVGALRLP